MFRFVLKKSRRRIFKAKQSDDAKEILNRINTYLHENAEEPVELLTRFWDDQQKAITYQELRQIVLAGLVSVEQIEEWRKDYSVLVNNSLKTLWETAIKAGAYSQPLLDDKTFSFDMTYPGVQNWIKERGSAFVTAITDEQRKAVSSLLLRGVEQNSSVDEVARNIRTCIGLTSRQSIAAANLYEHTKQALRKQHPRMWDSTIETKARHTAQMYAERAHRQRAMNIARTEMAYAYNQGADFGIRQAYRENLIGAYKKVWTTSGDEGVCSYCAGLDGKEVGMDGNFGFGRGLFGTEGELPPAHPNCACAIEYIEIEPPTFQELIVKDVTDEYINDATPGIGKVEMEKGYKAGSRQNEVETAQWLHDTLGGDIVLLKESDKDSQKMPDFLWKNKLWELKNTTTIKSADDAIRRGLKQIIENPGGIILDYGCNEIEIQELERLIESRIRRKRTVQADIMIILQKKLEKVLRYKK